jgi:hypothetical protein
MTSFTADLSKINYHSTKDKFTIVDDKTIIFTGNFKIAQHRAFFDRVMSKLLYIQKGLARAS